MRWLAEWLADLRARRRQRWADAAIVERVIDNLEQGDRDLEQRVGRLKTVVEARYDLLHRDDDAS